MIINFGLTNKRYNQMMEHYGGNEDAVRCIAEEWGAAKCNAGYCIVEDKLSEGKSALHIERIDAVAAFASDREAALQAAKDGIPLIPEGDLAELPAHIRRTAWVDEPGTRAALSIHESYVKRAFERERQISRIKGDISAELFKIRHYIDQLQNRASRIPVTHTNPEVLQDFYHKVLSLKYAAAEAAVYRII